MESRGSFQLENSHRSTDIDILLSGKTVLHKLSSFLSNKMMSVKWMFELKTHIKVCVYVDEGTCQLVRLTDVFLKLFAQ